MDLLQRELQRKKQALAKAKEQASHNSNDDDDHTESASKKRKYFKVSDLKRIEEEEEEAEQLRKHQQERRQETVQYDESASSGTNEQQKTKKTKKKSNRKKLDQQEPISSSPAATTTAAAAAATLLDGRGQDDNRSPAAITRKLRQMGLVVRYFGEGNAGRRKRLQEAMEQQSKALQNLSELEEFRLGKGHGIRNPFLERDSKSDTAKQQKKRNESAKPAVAVAKEDKKNGKEGDGEDDDDQSDPPKYIYRFLKGLLKDWEEDLANRPEAVANSVPGKNESKTLKQCKDYIRPLFKLLKSRTLEDGLQLHLLKIVNFAKQGEFVKAHDAYMDVAIGRAAWPIGVTMVGIHARSGRAKIESANVAHVMNSELQRKYLTSVKRLLSYYQKKRTDVDPSKKVS